METIALDLNQSFRRILIIGETSKKVFSVQHNFFGCRVLAVGLKDFVAHGTSQKAQIKKDGLVDLSKAPKINSVVGILRHLGGTHERQVRESIRGLVRKSMLEGEGEEESDEDLLIATIPFFLCLASQSTLICDALLGDVLQFVDVDFASKWWW